jgi:hypothetical protein
LSQRNLSVPAAMAYSASIAIWAESPLVNLFHQGSEVPAAGSAQRPRAPSILSQPEVVRTEIGDIDLARFGHCFSTNETLACGIERRIEVSDELTVRGEHDGSIVQMV